MLVSASSEFVALCRAQVALLTQGLGAALSVVYLTEELVEEGTTQTKLIPVVAYPETAVMWEGSNAVTLLPDVLGSDTQHLLLSGTSAESASAAAPSLSPMTLVNAGNQHQQEESVHSLLPSTQIVLPLIQDGVVMGLLVTGREDRHWNEQERGEIERIAQTLAIARILDQRREWCEQQLSQQQRLQAKQRDLLDNLLHQFRNSLTALRTFGKLLLKRLLPGDVNRAVADNIVRESDRLQELLQQFDRVIDLTADDLEPRKLLPPTPLLGESIQPAPAVITLLPNGSSAQLCSVADVLEPLLASAMAIAAERNLNLQADIPAQLPLVRANSRALRELLSNLVDNALKYTPSRGEIYIQAGLEQGHFQGIAISDTGPGIPPEDLGHIFERHYRGVQSSSKIPGTGLGLAIARDLVDQLQGNIQVFSPAQHPAKTFVGGPGVTFIVWLPL